MKGNMFANPTWTQRSGTADGESYTDRDTAGLGESQPILRLGLI